MASTNIAAGGRSEIIASLDIGSTKVCIVVSRVVFNPNKNSEEIEILGVSQIHSPGLRKGVVINIDQTVEAIRKAKDEAELMAGVKIENVWCGVGGSHITSFNSKGMVAVKTHEVNSDDVKRVLDAAQAVAISDEQSILHVLPQNFIVDSQDGIKDPVGMSGVRLESNVHIITGSKMSLHNITKCAERAGLEVSGMILESYAGASASLSQDEKDLGVVLVDMGGGTSDILVYSQGAVVHTAVIPVGGNHLTQDISVGLRTPAGAAEEIKKKYGCAMTSLVDVAEVIEVPSVGGRNPRTISRANLTEVIEPRVEETLHLINNEIVKSGYQHLLGAGVVLTGGGSKLEGVVEFGEFIFEMPTRRGIALETTGLRDVVNDPSFTTAVGLCRVGDQLGDKNSQLRGQQIISKIRTKVSEIFDGMF